MVSCVSDFFHIAWYFWWLSMFLYVSVVHSFLLPSSIPLHECTRICGSIYKSWALETVSSLLLFLIKLLHLLIYSLYAGVFSFLLYKYIVVGLLGLMTHRFWFDVLFSVHWMYFVIYSFTHGLFWMVRLSGNFLNLLLSLISNSVVEIIFNSFKYVQDCFIS